MQYADIPNGFSFAGVPRYYRASIQSLRRAVSWWKTEKTEFCIHLGDILDGFNPPEKADEALERVVSEFDRLGKPHYHMLGNHCLYNHSRRVSPSQIGQFGAGLLAQNQNQNLIGFCDLWSRIGSAGQKFLFLWPISPGLPFCVI